MTGFEEWFSAGALPARYVIDLLIGVHIGTCFWVCVAAGKYILRD